MVFTVSYEQNILLFILSYVLVMIILMNTNEFIAKNKGRRRYRCTTPSIAFVQDTVDDCGYSVGL